VGREPWKSSESVPGVRRGVPETVRGYSDDASACPIWKMETQALRVIGRGWTLHASGQAARFFSAYLLGHLLGVRCPDTITIAPWKPVPVRSRTDWGKPQENTPFASVYPSWNGFQRWTLESPSASVISLERDTSGPCPCYGLPFCVHGVRAVPENSLGFSVLLSDSERFRFFLGDKLKVRQWLRSACVALSDHVLGKVVGRS
jgi:hypothetical protein